MMKTKYPAMTLSLILILLSALGPASVCAGKSADDEKPIRLYVTESAGPIGKIESYSPMAINGRVTRGDQLIWGGEILQAPIDRSVRVSLDSIGQVTLHSGAVARLSVRWRKAQESTTGTILIASLIRGNVAVKLQNDVEAYIEASGSALTSTPGASFKVGVGETGPVWKASAGTVTVETQAKAQGNYMIRPVGGRANIDVRLRKTREVQFIVTDEHDKPVPDVPVVLTISGVATLGSGATTVTVTTSALGIASAPVSAGAAIGTGTVTATVPGGASASVGVSAVSAGVLTGTTIGIIAAAVAAGTATTVIVTRQKDEIKPTSEPKITPSSVR